MTRNVYTVYHGTNLFAATLIKHYGVSLEAQRIFTDFGRGFYVTFNLKQAVRWAKVRANSPQVSAKLLEKLRVNPADYLNHPSVHIPVVAAWDIDLQRILRLKGKISPFPNNPNWESSKSSWEDFVLKCRNGIAHKYDFVYGPIAGGHFKNEKKIRVSKTKDQLSLNTYQAISFLENLRIYINFNDNIRNHNDVPFLREEIVKAVTVITGLDKEYANRLLADSWVSFIHQDILISESPYYWAFSILHGKKALWHDIYEKWCNIQGMNNPST